VGRVVVEGWVYEYCHADDCHTFVYPRPLTPRDVEEAARARVIELLSTGVEDEVRYIVHGFVSGGYVDWLAFETLRREAAVPCELLERFKGRRVRITIEEVGR